MVPPSSSSMSLLFQQRRRRLLGCFSCRVLYFFLILLVLLASCMASNTPLGVVSSAFVVPRQAERRRRGGATTTASSSQQYLLPSSWRSSSHDVACWASRGGDSLYSRNRRGGLGHQQGNIRSKRQERVGQLVQTEVSQILHTGHIVSSDSSYLPDNLRHKISIVNVDISPDLRQARISVSIRGTGTSGSSTSSPSVEKRRIFSWLVENTKQIRHSLCQQKMSHMKICPNLTFVQIDVGAATDVMYLIDQISAQQQQDKQQRPGTAEGGLLDLDDDDDDLFFGEDADDFFNTIDDDMSSSSVKSSNNEDK